MPVPDPRIVFMGTPDFAVGSLKAIVDSGFKVAGVVTAPDKPSGRGQKIAESPVKQYASRLNLQILQPEKLRDETFLSRLRQLEADLHVVVAFRMLPEAVWNMPVHGTINLHASLLPQYRGAAPINWAIMNGETVTGVTTFFINHEIDTGTILMREEVCIGPDETAGELHDRLMVKGADLLVKTMKSIFSDAYRTIDQDAVMAGNLLRSAPRITKQDCRINWHLSSRDIHNFIRGLSPYPGAWTEIRCRDNAPQLVKIFAAEATGQPCSANPGTIETDGSNFLKVSTGSGYLNIMSLQLQGKKRLGISEFLRGFSQMELCRFL